MAIGTPKGDVFKNYYKRTFPVAPDVTSSSKSVAPQKKPSDFCVATFCASSDQRTEELQSYVFGNYYLRAKK